MLFKVRRHEAARRAISPKLLIAGVIAAVALIGYFTRSAVNPVTGQKQRVALSVDQEIALGLRSAPEMARQFGGLLEDRAAQERVDRVGARLLRGLPNGGAPYVFEFHVLADGNTVNAFALPGGQVFITAALYSRLTTEGQLAGVLGHEIGHVVERHSAEQIAKSQLTAGLLGAATVATTDPDHPEMRAGGAIAAVVAQLVTLKYGRDDELESDRWGVELLSEAGYDPRALLVVMDVLARATQRDGAPPEFMSTHPDPGNRAVRIRGLIAEKFPGGVPGGMEE